MAHGDAVRRQYEEALFRILEEAQDGLRRAVERSEQLHRSAVVDGIMADDDSFLSRTERGIRVLKKALIDVERLKRRTEARE